MKKYYYLAICLCAALTGLYLISCDKDDDDDNVLVGTWCEDEYDSGYYSGQHYRDDDYITFFSDGTGYVYTIEHGESDTYLIDVRDFTYIYDAKNMRLVMTLARYYGGYNTETLDIVSISSKKLVIREYDSSAGSHETNSFSKVPDPVTRNELERKAKGDYSSSYYY